EGWPFVMETGGENPLARTVWLHDTDGELSSTLLGERDVVAAWRPHRRRVVAFAERYALRLAAARRHHVNLWLSATVGLETDLRAHGSVEGRGVGRRRVGQPRGAGVRFLDLDNVRVAPQLQA